ncbi:curli-like amyloid fiber formation chaperone CsgH [Eoetvoesiella caeni]|uniref:Curli assembly protein CsgC n=1 Tax=Eoetvoesiella caeni TaxID=645616 RepID=A0A366HHB6_9BURK|nr:curli-like amyloid fiber formation chaperone CsgH [Eoetvoesiella caeni]MCI2808558.1 hypothetical protein [Eoetvoesiella caeni]NYT55098.1 hypothetical protein [Eoetvoesiella caeni]RBP40922.1 thin aggregative fimbriae synthesis protein [Eoetvoesiella caeni]
MFIDGNIQVWLEADKAKDNIITPYIRSPVQQTLQYRVRATKEGSHGRSEISQSGTITTQAQQAMALGTMSMNIAPTDTCRIELSLAEGGVFFAMYLLDCPR